MDRLALLKALSFGSQVAEDEINELVGYFVETDQWNRIFNGEIDIVRGEKGSGKSAIYLLLDQNSDNLFNRNVITITAENPRGATVFKDLIPDPPTGEAEFVILWKIYLITLIAHELRRFGFHGAEIDPVYASLEDAKLMETELNLSSLLRAAQSFARRILAGGTKIEGGVELDQATGMPSGIIGRISLAEPNGDLRAKGYNSIDGLFEKINNALSKEKYVIWVLMDRLDVAFAEAHQLEANALKALIRVYGDIRSLDNVSLKIFLREDIWKRVMSEGLREASHLTKYQIMAWTTPALLNLVMRRLLNNEILVSEYGINKDAVLSNADSQEELFYRLFPAKVELGRNPKTFSWMVARCADGTGNTAPRELIHLLRSILEQEIRRLELGGRMAPDEQLFDRSVFKAALPVVSKARLTTYLYAEYPNEKLYIEKLEGEKAEQTPESLAALWNMSPTDAVGKAQQLVDLGLFEQRGDRASPTYWVPFLYRDALNLVQGKAEQEQDEED